MISFDKAIEHVLKWEGGYVNHPNDPGGETKFGITKRSYPHLNIRSLTIEKAIDIYKRDFWDRYGVDKLPDEIKLQFFDTSINCGYTTAVKVLQRTLNGVLHDDLKVDGILGKNTLASTYRLRAYNENIVKNEYQLHRLHYYFTIIEKNKRLSVFMRGWMNRTIKTY